MTTLLCRRASSTDAMLDTVRALMWHKDAQGRVTLWNRAAEGKPMDGLTESEAEVLRTGKAKFGVIADKDGRWYRKDILPNPAGGLIFFAVDVTEMKRAEEMQKHFVANVSHEIRTPIAAIKGFAETLRSGALRDSRTRLRFVRIIESHADRLGWLVDELMTVSALEGGRKIEPQAVEAAPLVKGLLAGLAPVAEKRKLTLAGRIPHALRLRVDPPFFLQALENLVGNAIKFNRPGGWVRVSATVHGKLARLTVRDNGAGIAPQHLEKVFERFFRVKKGAQPGSGLGLHIVRRVAEAHGGTAWAESRGRGSAFHLTVPLA